MGFDKQSYDIAYAKTHFYRVPLNVPIEMKEVIKNRSVEKGYDSITKYIQDLIYNDLNSCTKNIHIENINQQGDSNTINIG